jgi:hypothetical protein
MISLLGVNIRSLVFFPKHPKFMLIIQSEDKIWLTQNENFKYLNEV